MVAVEIKAGGVARAEELLLFNRPVHRAAQVRAAPVNGQETAVPGADQVEIAFLELGDVFNLPMSTITIIEDALMIGMSGIMFIAML